MAEMTITQPVPLMRGDDGVFHVVGTRVTLDSIIHQFKAGATAEQIQEDFPTVALRDMYSVIAYYLQHSREVEEYLNQQALAAADTRRELEQNPATGELRERLKRRRSQAAA